jgi:quinol monooxygenase YgiN
MMGGSNMLTFVATFKALPGKEDAVAEIIKKLAAAARQETGNRRYDLFRSLDDPTTFISYEDYDDQDAVRAHATADYVKAFVTELNPLLDGGSVTLRRLQDQA